MGKTISRFDGEYRWLSNFWPAEVMLDGVRYPTVEHAYQAAKVEPVDRSLFERGSPGQAKRMSKVIPHRDIDWGRAKVVIMRSLLKQKFAPGSNLGRALFETGDAQLIEGNTWGDTFWGVCNGTGSNMLGILLMEQRAILQAESESL